MQRHRSISRETQDQLERLVDSHGLELVLGALSNICAEKSAHVAENWQDTKLAKTWMACMNILDRTADNASIREISQ